MCRFVPPYLLARLAELPDDDPAGHCGRTTLELDTAIRERRRQTAPAPAADSLRWSIYTANNTTELPGSVVRRDGEEPSADAAVDEAYDGVEASWRLFEDVFSYASVDGNASRVDATVHYGVRYANAFWDGQRLVFGDGDGEVFERFTKPIGVLAHEYVHGVTQFTAGLEYANQPGALNESISDVFAAIVKQRALDQTPDEADWLIGEGIFTANVQGLALRSMKEPGTAYDDPRIGTDPQVGSMSEYVETTEDNGGVHINSGIPNRAFYLAATALGGRSWEAPGAIWWGALTGGQVEATTEFAGFANATLTAAADQFGAESIEWTAVRDAWVEVGVLDSDGNDGSSGARRVTVRRSGGFAGLVTESELDLAADPAGAEAAALLDRIDLARLPATDPQPDRYVYMVRIDGREVRVNEQDLTPDLARLVDLVLGSS